MSGEREPQERALLAELETALAADDPVGELRARRLIADLLTPYIDPIQGWLGVQLGGRRAEDATEVVLVRLVALLRRKQRFQQPFGAVVWKNVRWALRDFLRGEDRKAPEMLVGEDPRYDDEDVAGVPDPAEDARRFRELLGERVSERDRRVLWESVVEGRSSREIAEELEMTEIAVNTAKSRALAKLRRGGLERA